jgi:hypothetical protein
MDASDLLGIAMGAVNSSDIGAGTVVNVGSCNFLSATSTTASVGSSGVVSTGCVGTNNTDEQVSYVATGPVLVTVYGQANRSDEIIYYSLNLSSAACKSVIVTTVLPVRFISFEAFKKEEGFDLKWATATEINNNYFIVEYSTDAYTFIPFDKVKGSGNSYTRRDYESVLSNFPAGKNFYFRIKQVDYNGQSSYSPIIQAGTSLGFPKADPAKITAFYNAEKDKIIVRFHLDYPQLVNFNLVELEGIKKGETEERMFDEGDYELQVAAPQNAGVYLLNFQRGDNNPEREKIVIAK